MTYSARRAWEAGELKRRPLLTRCQKYAALTLTTICTPDGYNEQNEELQTDYQSLGAQGVNNVANKLMLALFSPSKPFFMLDMTAEVKASLQKLPGYNEQEVQAGLSVAERNCIKQLDRMAVRPKLNELFKHLIITGNALLIFGDPKEAPIRVMGIKHYCVKRSMSGRVIDLLIQEYLCFDELEKDVQDYMISSNPTMYTLPSDETEATKVKYYKHVQWDGKIRKYIETSYVDDVQLGDAFSGTYTDEELPYRVLTWDLSDENDYGTGLVEQCAGDLSALSCMSEAEVKGAILASEFRWLVNPAGMTKPEELENSENGAALPGAKDDIIPLLTGTGANMQFIDAIASNYVKRIGQIFLLGASIVRQAERVTAEEIRLLANELETSLGGVYSRLAVDLQLPMAYWLIRVAGIQIQGTKLKPTVITGLDALSRNGDLENLKLCLQDLAALSEMPPQLLSWLKVNSIADAIFAGRGVDGSQFIKSASEQQADLKDEQQAALAQQVARPATQAVLNQDSK